MKAWSPIICIWIIVVFTGSCQYLTKQYTHRTASSVEEVVSKNLPIVTSCDLFRSTEEFDGAYIRLQASIIPSLHGYKFDAETCIESYESIPILSPPIAIDVIHSNVTSNAERIKDVLSVKVGAPKKRFVSIGRFRRVKPSEKSDAWIDRLPWQFEIYSIENEIVESNADSKHKPDGWAIPNGGELIS